MGGDWLPPRDAQHLAAQLKLKEKTVVTKKPGVVCAAPGPFKQSFTVTGFQSGQSLRRIGNAIVSEISIHSVTGAALKHVRTLIDQARSLGLEAIPERGGSHFKLRLSDGQRRSTLVVSGSPSCRRAAKNNLSAIRRFASGHNLFH